MARRWTAEDIEKLESLARNHSAADIAERIDRSVGGIVFKAHKLRISLRPRRRLGESNIDPGPCGIDWTE
jgi:hypothetical protein